VKLVETKIYLKFIIWFLVVAILPIILLFTIVYIFYPELIFLNNEQLQRSILIGIFISLASVFLLSLIATKRLSKALTQPISISVIELSKVVKTLLKTVNNLIDISKSNSNVSTSLLSTSKEQQKGLKVGSKAVEEMFSSLSKVAKKTKVSSTNASKIDSLVKKGEDNINIALDGLVVMKHLASDNQKLNNALNHYAQEVKDIAKRVAVLAETAKFFSLNVNIQANKESFGEELTALVSQIRELNITSEQAAVNIQALSADMQKQLEQAKESSLYEHQEISSSIKIIGQTIQFLKRITPKVSDISKGMLIINKETQESKQDASNINTMINDLNNDGKSLVRQSNNISKTIEKQDNIIKSLNRSSSSLEKVTNILDDLVGKQ